MTLDEAIRRNPYNLKTSGRSKKINVGQKVRKYV